MTTTKHTLKSALTFGVSFEPQPELGIRVEYEVAWGSPARINGPPEDCDPGSPDEVSITRVLLLAGGTLPQPMIDALQDDDGFLDTLRNEAVEDEAAAADEAAEHRAELSREATA